jgi:hypothetical protein
MSLPLGTTRKTGATCPESGVGKHSLPRQQLYL